MNAIRTVRAAVVVAILGPVAVVGQEAPATTATAPAAEAAAIQTPFSTDRGAPIEVTAETFAGSTEEAVWVYRGDVLVTQGALKIRADEMRLVAPGNELSRIEAVGGVTFVSESGTALGQTAVYDMKSRELRLAGNVVLRQKDNVMRGAELVVELPTGKARLVGGRGEGGRPGRVQGVFVPGQQRPQGAAPATQN